MGIAGVVRDKDTELGIADAVIAVDGLNHDVTTGAWGPAGSVEVWEGVRLGQTLRITGSSPSLHSSQRGAGITGAC